MIDTSMVKLIVQELKEHGFTDTDGQVLMLAEEVGEFVGAYRRYVGKARRMGNFDDVEKELADVVIGALCVAQYLEMDINTAIDKKLRIIFSRGWRDAEGVL